MSEIVNREAKEVDASFSQNGEKNTSIGTAQNVTINNLQNPTDQESITSSIANMENVLNKIRLYEEMGITNCAKELQGTPLEPKQCMRDVQKSLSFMGVGGEKWVKDTKLYELFENMLRQTKSMNGEVRFLLINPASEAFGLLYKLRGESVPHDSYGKFAELSQRFDNLKVRLYSDMPSFRMQFVDESYLAISRYYFDKISHDNSLGGWKTPHLIICNEQRDFERNEPKYKGSLYKSFWLSYNFIWSRSDEIQKWVDEGKKYNK